MRPKFNIEIWEVLLAQKRTEDTSTLGRGAVLVAAVKGLGLEPLLILESTEVKVHILYAHVFAKLWVEAWLFVFRDPPFYLVVLFRQKPILYDLQSFLIDWTLHRVWVSAAQMISFLISRSKELPLIIIPITMRQRWQYLFLGRLEGECCSVATWFNVAFHTLWLVSSLFCRPAWDDEVNGFIVGAKRIAGIDLLKDQSLFLNRASAWVHLGFLRLKEAIICALKVLKLYSASTDPLSVLYVRRWHLW